MFAQLLGTVANATEMGFTLDALLYLMEAECAESSESAINRKCRELVSPLYMLSVCDAHGKVIREHLILKNCGRNP